MKLATVISAFGSMRVGPLCATGASCLKCTKLQHFSLSSHSFCSQTSITTHDLDLLRISHIIRSFWISSLTDCGCYMAILRKTWRGVEEKNRSVWDLADKHTEGHDWRGIKCSKNFWKFLGSETHQNIPRKLIVLSFSEAWLLMKLLWIDQLLSINACGKPVVNLQFPPTSSQSCTTQMLDSHVTVVSIFFVIQVAFQLTFFCY